jgi:glutaminase
VQKFNFPTYDNLSGLSCKENPRLSRVAQQAVEVNELIWAASKGDLGAIHERVSRGTDLNCADYDLRTPLHLAAAEGQLGVVKFFTDQHRADPAGIELNPRDRWGGTPLDDAYLNRHGAIAELLERAGGVRHHDNLQTIGSSKAGTTTAQTDSGLTNELIWAASLGDLDAVRRLVARGVVLEEADYDLRTPLHLAAAEGHLAVVRYLIAHKVRLNPRDRWGNTPLDDALRHQREEVVEVLRQAGGRSNAAFASACKKTKP